MELARARVESVRPSDRTLLVRVRLPRAVAERAAGLQVQETWVGASLPEAVEPLPDEAIVCRCERVTAGEIRALIRAGMRDANEIKTVSRAGMGACGGKTCSALIARLFREAGVPASDVTENVKRPLFVEVPFGAFAGVEEGA
jgi:NAD(P)H-nitrite reductase large subunit